MTDNIYEQSGRLTKAFAIAQAIWKIGGTAEDARLMTDADWSNAATLAKYKKPPSDETRRVCIEMLAGFRSEAA
jgi:hypothetical protein